MRKGLPLLVAIMLAACSTTPTTTTSAPTVATTAPVTTTVPATTTLPVALGSFSIPVGSDGVTYDLEGSPPSGPSSFAIESDGTVVVADTHAARRGEPRLLRYPVRGQQEVVDLTPFGVEAIVDVAWLDGLLVVLDVDVARNNYRVLTLDGAALVDEIAIPEGSRFPQGLTGIVVDDSGWLLEFELGARFERLDTSGVTPVRELVLGGVSVQLELGSEGDVVHLGSEAVAVDRATEIGGTFIVGLAPDGVLVVVVDEVSTDGGSIVVDRSVRRYSPTGDLLSEIPIDLTLETVDIPRPVELAPDGTTVYLFARPSEVGVAVFDG